jgi:hypothetical protein
VERARRINWMKMIKGMNLIRMTEKRRRLIA